MESVFNTSVMRERNDLEIIASKAIQELRVFVHYKGYRYLRSSIKLTVNDETLADDMGKGIYLMVAEEYGTTVSRVERAMRNAIEKAWEQADPRIVETYFGYYDPDDCPSNKRFITTVADYIRLRL